MSPVYADRIYGFGPQSQLSSVCLQSIMRAESILGLLSKDPCLSKETLLATLRRLATTRPIRSNFIACLGSGRADNVKDRIGCCCAYCCAPGELLNTSPEPQGAI